jgi:hypothetical protein
MSTLIAMENISLGADTLVFCNVFHSEAKMVRGLFERGLGGKSWYRHFHFSSF